VALSGGVDSSTAAALLKEGGFDVVAAIMVFEGIPCDAVGVARHLAQHLNIPFHIFDFTNEFHNAIITNFIKEYGKGRTPNPCILCNELIKFGLLLKKAEELGVNKIATGHYVRIEKHNGRYLLKRGVDKNEQSYFLYRLQQKQLSKIIMPIGSYKKVDVRRLARKLKLPFAQRKKSQDICFIPDGDCVAYLQKLVPTRVGPVYDKSGQKIGEHKGILFYTYGQRRGIGIRHTYPYYVTKIDAENNALYVGEKKDVYKSQLIAKDLRFFSFDILEKKLQVMAKARYASPLSRATIEPFAKDRVKVTFAKSQWALTPGQSVVFYQDDILVGGGIIDEIL